jgi:hypothetical protein
MGIDFNKIKGFKKLKAINVRNIEEKRRVKSDLEKKLAKNRVKL